jgi:hypothetical protein
MIDLRAESYHSDVLRLGPSLVVHAVFDRALHLHAPEGWIVTVAAGLHDGPLGIRVRPEDLTRVTVAPGDVVRMVCGRIPSPPTPLPYRERGDVGAEYLSLSHSWERRVPSGWGGEGIRGVRVLRIHLANAAAWQPHTIPTPIDPDRLGRDILSAIRAAKLSNRGGLQADLVLGAAIPGGPTWLRHGIAAARALLSALIRGDEKAIPCHTLALLGLGPGLTPAGDDLLCGLLAGRAIFAERGGTPSARTLPGWAALRRTVAEAAAERTTSLSRTLLRYAPLGVATEPLLHVLWSLGTPEGSHGIDTLLGLGHSSGSDMLTGAHLAASWSRLGGRNVMEKIGGAPLVPSS